MKGHVKVKTNIKTTILLMIHKMTSMTVAIAAIVCNEFGPCYFLNSREKPKTRIFHLPNDMVAFTIR